MEVRNFSFVFFVSSNGFFEILVIVIDFFKLLLSYVCFINEDVYGIELWI